VRNLSYVILPIFELKIILLGIFFILALHLLKNGKTINKTYQVFFLTLVYTLNFLSVPYWSLKPGVIHVTISFLILIAGYILFILGCYKSTADFRLPGCKDKVVFYFGVLFVAAVILNYLPMLNSISYRGDADYHIRVTMGFFLYLTNNMHYLYIFLILLLVSIWCAVTQRDYFIFLIPLFVIAFCIFSQFLYLNTFPSWIKRYPSLFYLFNSVFSIPMTSVFIQNQFFIESNYRIFILVSTVIIAVYAISRINSTNGILKALIGLYILTIPVLHYYSSLIYIDMVMILFAFIAVFNFEQSLHRFTEKRTINQTFFFIILLSFIKETSLVYLLVFCFFAGYIIYFKTNDDIQNKIYLWGKFAIITLIPLLVFLYFRDVPHNPYNLALKNLLVFGNYKVLLMSLWEQFGFLLPAAGLSIVYLLIRKKYFPVIFNLCLIIGYVLFFMLNGKISSTFINNDSSFAPLNKGLRLTIIFYVYCFEVVKGS